MIIEWYINVYTINIYISSHQGKSMYASSLCDIISVDERDFLVWERMKENGCRVGTLFLIKSCWMSSMWRVEKNWNGQYGHLYRTLPFISVNKYWNIFWTLVTNILRKYGVKIFLRLIYMCNDLIVNITM